MTTATATVSSTLPNGRVPFTVTVDKTGRVTDITAPQLQLPEAAWRLTYGSKWAEIRADVYHEAAALPFRAEVMIWQSGGGKSFRAIRTAFRTLEGRSLDELDDKTDSQDLAAFARRFELLDLFSNWPANFRQGLSDLRAKHKLILRERTHYPRRLQPYLLAQLPLQDADTRDRLYATLGLIGDETIRELLLTELERPGRHSYTTGLLAGLTKFRDTDTRDRILSLYEPAKMTDEHVQQYLYLLQELPGEEVDDRIREVLGDYPDSGQQVVWTLSHRKWSDDRIATLLHRHFDTRDEYFTLLNLLKLINQLDVAGKTIDLTTLNERLDRPAFTDLPPVSWPQQLERSWRELLHATPPSVRQQVIERYLLSEIPRLQRNALLQLVDVQRELREGEKQEPLSLVTERRVRELIAARYDKVYTLALKVFGLGTVAPIHEPELLLAALADRSLQKLYRIMVIQALRQLIGNSALSWSDVWQHYFQQIAGADDGTLSGVEGFLIYLNKHGDTEPLRLAIEQRRSVLTAG